MKGIQISKEVQLSLFIDDKIKYIENPKEFTKILLVTVNHNSKLDANSQYTKVGCILLYKE